MFLPVSVTMAVDSNVTSLVLEEDITASVKQTLLFLVRSACLSKVVLI